MTTILPAFQNALPLVLLVATACASSFVSFELDTRQWQPHQETLAMETLDGSIEYWATIHIGTPPRPFRVQLDTGSSTLGIPSSQCGQLPNTQCGSTTPPRAYDPSNSSTSALLPGGSKQCQAVSQFDSSACEFSVSYADGSGIDGFLYRDVISLGVFNASAVFGGIVNERYRSGGGAGFETKNVDGILGLAYTRLDCNPTCEYTVFDYFVESCALPNFFAMCVMPSHGDNGSGASPGGVWDLGAADPNKGLTPMQFTPVKRGLQTGQFDYYTVEPVWFGFKMGGNFFKVEADFSTVRPIVDSGTTLMYFPNALLRSLVAEMSSLDQDLPGFSKLFDASAEDCPIATSGEVRDHLITEQDARQWPTISFQMPVAGNESALFSLDLEWSQYMGPFGELAGTMYWSVLPGLAGTIACGGDTTFILGDSFMRGWYIGFDRGQHRVGFSPLNLTDRNRCSSSLPLSDAPVPGNVTCAFPNPLPDLYPPDSSLWGPLMYMLIAASGAVVLVLLCVLIRCIKTRRHSPPSGAAQFDRMNSTG